MSPRRLKTLLTALATLAIAVGVAGPAHASSRQSSILMDDTEFIAKGPENGQQRLDEARALGVDVIRVILDWRQTAPAREPRDATDPAAYGSAWDRYDQFVRDATARGIQVYFSLGGTAPDWASGRGRRPGVAKIDTGKYGQFVKAVGTHFDGNHGVPAVHMWAIWNEPNLKYWIDPSYVRGIAYSPQVYRSLLQAGGAALSATGHGADTILIGELAPIGGMSYRVPPMEFLRELACVDNRFRPYKGAAARARGCSTRGSSPRLPGTGLAYHPYGFSNGPSTPAPGADNATMAQLSRITSTLAKIRGRFRDTRTKPLYITEFGFESNPPDRYRGSPLSKIPAYLGEAEWMAYTNRQVASYTQYSLVDDRLGGVNNAFGFGGFQSGLRYGSDADTFGQTPYAEKPGVYDAFRSPFFVRDTGRGSVELFGAARPLHSGGFVQVEQRIGNGGFTPLGGPIPINSRGYFDQTVPLSRISSRRFRFSYTDVDGTTIRHSAELAAVRR